MKKYFHYKTSQKFDINVLATANQLCKVTDVLELELEKRTAKTEWTFLIMDGMDCHCILGIHYIKFIGSKVNYPNESITSVNLDEKLDRPTHENVNIK